MEGRAMGFEKHQASAPGKGHLTRPHSLAAKLALAVCAVLLAAGALGGCGGSRSDGSSPSALTDGELALYAHIRDLYQTVMADSFSELFTVVDLRQNGYFDQGGAASAADAANVRSLMDSIKAAPLRWEEVGPGYDAMKQLGSDYNAYRDASLRFNARLGRLTMLRRDFAADDRAKSLLADIERLQSRVNADIETLLKEYPILSS